MTRKLFSFFKLNDILEIFHQPQTQTPCIFNKSQVSGTSFSFWYLVMVAFLNQFITHPPTLEKKKKKRREGKGWSSIYFCFFFLFRKRF
jgi:hypothetical protein